jgi:hypothetical protein
MTQPLLDLPPVIPCDTLLQPWSCAAVTLTGRVWPMALFVYTKLKQP